MLKEQQTAEKMAEEVTFLCSHLLHECWLLEVIPILKIYINDNSDLCFGYVCKLHFVLAATRRRRTGNCPGKETQGEL